MTWRMASIPIGVFRHRARTSRSEAEPLRHPVQAKLSHPFLGCSPALGLLVGHCVAIFAANSLNQGVAGVINVRVVDDVWVVHWPDLDGFGLG